MLVPILKISPKKMHHKIILSIGIIFVAVLIIKIESNTIRRKHEIDISYQDVWSNSSQSEQEFNSTIDYEINNNLVNEEQQKEVDGKYEEEEDEYEEEEYEDEEDEEEENETDSDSDSNSQSESDSEDEK